MKKIIFFAVAIFISLQIFGQNDIVKWEWVISQNQINNNEYTINIHVEIKQNWYVYGMNIDEGGPLPLSFSFDNNEEYLSYAEFEEIIPGKKEFDEVFKMEISTYVNKAEFKCNIKTSKNIDNFKLFINGQACNKGNGSCFPIFEEININLKK